MNLCFNSNHPSLLATPPKSLLHTLTAAHLAHLDAASSCDVALAHVAHATLFVTPAGEALFSFLAPNSSVSCVRMPPLNSAALLAPSAQSMPVRFELNQPSIVSRLWSGISR